MAGVFYCCMLLFITGVTGTSQNTSYYFRQSPKSADVLVGTAVTFKCQAAWAAQRVRWEYNDRGWDILDPPYADLKITPDGTWNSSLYSRNLVTTIGTNTSRVQCVLTLRGGGERVYSDVAGIIVRDFSKVPESVNTTLGSMVEFHCVPYYPQYTILWYINGTQLGHLNNSDISLISGTNLVITASYLFNNTRVYCQLSSTSITSRPAILLIQGELGVVSDLHVTEYSTSSIQISWTPPFSLDISQSDRDVWYTLSILHTTSGVLISCPDCQNITNTSHTLPISEMKPGIYEISVVAANACCHSKYSAMISLVYVKMVTRQSDSNQSTASIKPTPDNWTLAISKACSQYSTTTDGMHQGTLIAVTVGVILSVLLAVLGTVSLCSYLLKGSSSHCLRQVSRRRRRRRETIQRNPAYETCITQHTYSTDPVGPSTERNGTISTLSDGCGADQDKVYEEVL